MTEDESAVEVPNSTLAKLRYSITNLWEDYGRQEQIGIAFAVNVGLTIIGTAIYATADGWIAFAGAVWAILHVLAIIKWVVGL